MFEITDLLKRLKLTNHCSTNRTEGIRVVNPIWVCQVPRVEQAL